jgi:hypothetical protein
MTASPADSIPVAPRPEAAIRSRRRIGTGVLIALCCLAIYNANRRSISAGDTYPARYLPFAIVQYHTAFMNPVAGVAEQGRGDTAFWMLRLPDGHLMSLYPIVVPVLVAPLYIPAVAWLHMKGWNGARLEYVATVMEKLTASLLAALSAALLHALLRRRTGQSTALLLTAAYAFGTTTWVISSQALWQHGMAQLLVVIVLLLLTGPYSTSSAVAVGLLCGLIACNRPPDIVLAAALGAHALFWAKGWRRAVLLASAAALPMLVVFAYNLHYAANVAGGYGIIGSARFFRHPVIPGIAGLLFSPAKGLFIYSPFLLFLVLAFRCLPRGREERRLTQALAVAVVVQIVLYAKVDWRGGLSWGPRYMTDLLPFLIWMLVPVVESLRRAGRVLFVIAVGVAIAIEAIGAFCYSGWFDDPVYVIKDGPGEMRAAWKWESSAVLKSLREGAAPPDLWIERRGTIDGLEVDGRQISAVTAGQQVLATGWALAGHDSPAQVGVMIDGRGFASTTFVDRPDVRAALDEASPAGWSVALDTSGLAPGEHRVTAMVWASGKGEGRYIGERSLVVREDGIADSTAPDANASTTAAASGDQDLGAAFSQAVARIRAHQQPEGYWLTAHTSGPRYQEPRPEMNTYLTSLLVDELDSIASRSGLDESLRRARAHLTDQIESDGLVRYHGRPDAPWIGTLGCAITPDTDDTALIWRLAPAPDRGRLSAALATIDQYRTPEGLYRSWLAPREDFRCLDPGTDPNPADIGIQMNLLLLLSEAKPEAGRELCELLRSVVDQDRIWVYYRRAPLAPTLRLADLHRAGCDLELPESRMLTAVPGQQIWISIARMLGNATTADPLLMRAVLRELARDDFALVRTNPPLFYHNDLTATVSRYYWSEDFGYALWLRLQDEYERTSP